MLGLSGHISRPNLATKVANALLCRTVNYRISVSLMHLFLTCVSSGGAPHHCLPRRWTFIETAFNSPTGYLAGRCCYNRSVTFNYISHVLQPYLSMYNIHEMMAFCMYILTGRVPKIPSPCSCFVLQGKMIRALYSSTTCLRRA